MPSRTLLALDFEHRVALLEEHLVRPAAEHYLAAAERHLAMGEESSARLSLAIARGERRLEQLRQRDDEAD